MKQTAAIIGTGIAGMACAHYLKDLYDLTIYEKNNYTWGHTNTVSVSEGNHSIPIDTGFMVFNEATYPNLIRLFEELGVESVETDMSFGVQHRMKGLEYACSNLNTFFAQRVNFANPKHWKLLTEILRFFREAKAYMAAEPTEAVTLKKFLETGRFKKAFMEDYLLPMTAAIWSTPPSLMLEYPALSLFRFLENHRLLGVGIQLKWRTVKGGSSTYRDKIMEPLKGNIHSSSKVMKIRKTGEQASVVLENGQCSTFDRVIVATHADQALTLLENPSKEEQTLLGAFSYTRNPVVLHSDNSVMPSKRNAWASWNFRMEKDESENICSSTHYWMNNLQKVSEKRDYFVSVDYAGPIDPAKVHWTYTYEHPQFTMESIRAQQVLPKLNETGPVYFCGSYFRNGFHEDALVSALAVVKQLKERTEVSHELLSL